jgi:hypothetical protein
MPRPRRGEVVAGFMETGAAEEWACRDAAKCLTFGPDDTLSLSLNPEIGLGSNPPSAYIMIQRTETCETEGRHP